ncbi:MAG: S8 family serine peptidase [Patescibacteria group bacterium]
MFKKAQNKLIYITIFSLIVLPLMNFSSVVQAKEQGLSAHQAGELLVKLKSSQKIFKFKFSSDIELQELLDVYNSQDQVEYAEPNYIYKVSLEPKDTFYTQQLYLSKIKANRAWDVTTGSRRVTIAVVDSGVDLDHLDLKENIWFNKEEVVDNSIDDDRNGYIDDMHGWDFVGDDNNPNPDLSGEYSKTAISHGTVVAGIAAAQGGNKEGIAGISWSSKIMVLRVLDSQGYGTTDKVAKAIDYAVNNGADIINLSFVGTGKSLTLEKAIKRAYDAGVIVVAAAGNEVSSGIDMEVESNMQYPVCHDGPNGENWVIGVASIDNNDRLASFSNYGSKCIDLVAPGVRLFSTVYNDESNSDFKDYYQHGWTGTSVSAPQVAGAFALVKSYKPSFSAQQIKDLFFDNATDLDIENPAYKGKLGNGLINVYTTISKALGEQPEEAIKKELIITAAGQGGGPHVKVFRKNYLENEFFAFDSYYRGGLSVASGDLDRDGDIEVVVGLGKGTHPWFKIFSEEGELQSQFMAYADGFRGGVEVAIGDVDGDGLKEIITGAGQGGGPHIRIFSHNGTLKNHFFAFDKHFWGGVEVASGDVNSDGLDEIIVVAKSKHQPQVRVFNLKGELISEFLAFETHFTDGVHVATGDLDSDGKDEIIIGAGSGNSPYVKTFDLNGNLIKEFMAYHPNFKGGVYVASGDTDADGFDEIITGAGKTGGPHVRVFNKNGGLEFHFFAYNENFRGGVRVASGD